MASVQRIYLDDGDHVLSAAQLKEREAGEAVVDGDAGKFQCESCWALTKYSGIQTNMCVRIQRMYKRWARVRAYRGRVEARVRHAAESVVAVRIQAIVRGKQSRSAGLIEGLIKLAKGYEKAMDLAEALRLYETAELNLTTKLGEGNNLDDKLLVSTSANVIRLDNAVRVIGGEVDAAVKKARLLREGLEKINDIHGEGSSVAGTSLILLYLYYYLTPRRVFRRGYVSQCSMANVSVSIIVLEYYITFHYSTNGISTCLSLNVDFQVCTCVLYTRVSSSNMRMSLLPASPYLYLYLLQVRRSRQTRLWGMTTISWRRRR